MGLEKVMEEERLQVTLTFPITQPVYPAANGVTLVPRFTTNLPGVTSLKVQLPPTVPLKGTSID